MISEWLVWSVFLLPLVAFLVISLIVRPLFNKFAVVSGLILITCLAISFLISVYILSILSRGDNVVFRGSRLADIGLCNNKRWLAG
ncbi:MAG: hypothetical protein CM1200mP15_05460 [Dehalococcoidia bacterium]|nr:MAG: hypothetical protein CM1200mP15_05460 [Dehalococcoidia bacterium]